MKRLLLFLMLSGFASAQTLLPEANSLITQGVVSPFGQIPLTSGCHVGVGFSIINEQSYSEGNWGSMGIDAEVWRLDLSARAATEWGEFSGQLPVNYVWGGVLDAPLDAFHSLTSLDRIVNPKRDRSLSFYDIKGGRTVMYDQPAFGLGDPTVGWAYPLGNLWVKGSLSAPLGTHQQFIGSGAWRSSAGAGYSQDQMGLMGQVEWFWNPKTTDVSALGLRPSVGVKGWLPLPWNLPGRIETELRTSPFEVPGKFANFTWSLRLIAFEVGFQEDLTPSLPDVSLSTAREWNCF